MDLQGTRNFSNVGRMSARADMRKAKTLLHFLLRVMTISNVALVLSSGISRDHKKSSEREKNQANEDNTNPIPRWRSIFSTISNPFRKADFRANTRRHKWT